MQIASPDNGGRDSGFCTERVVRNYFFSVGLAMVSRIVVSA